jgi:hypothetical protein
VSEAPWTPSPYHTAIRLGDEVDEVRKQLAAAREEITTLKGYREAWEWLECVLFDVEYRPFVCEWECDGSWAKTPIDAVRKAMAWHSEQEGNR